MSSFDSPRITLQDVAGEGSSFKYYAFYGEQFSPGETGWVLVAEDTDPFIDPQALSSEASGRDVGQGESQANARRSFKDQLKTVRQFERGANRQRRSWSSICLHRLWPKQALRRTWRPCAK